MGAGLLLTLIWRGGCVDLCVAIPGVLTVLILYIQSGKDGWDGRVA
ncbi:hypothetical protein M8C21_000848 [Ambrosia artemisiifolia]|uniref:Uncharacterized protein n=1 Tax=Ambrosia artemisiifolia TaxID=4212 RepID=A0AAD5GIU7_AMBAR|nr:hypothetical protein M8C21_000848 [Ambrosia artemisiifolia]